MGVRLARASNCSCQHIRRCKADFALFDANAMRAQCFVWTLLSISKSRQALAKSWIQIPYILLQVFVMQVF